MSGGVMTPEVDPPGVRAALRGFGPAAVVAFLVIVMGALVFMPIAAVLILVWAWATGAWREVGLARPQSWVGGLALGLVLGIGLKLVMKALVMPLFGAPPTNALYHNLVGNGPAAIRFAVYAVLGAGFAEELFFRGYLFERSARLFGAGTGATAATVVIVTLLFGAAHWQQGMAGMINAGVTGLVAALVFLFTGRKLWVPVVMHATFDLTAGAIIYLNLETVVSHLVFK
jgi:uncharacterized protein